MEKIKQQECCQDLELNEETRKALEDAQNRKDLTEIKNVKDLFQKLSSC